MAVQSNRLLDTVDQAPAKIGRTIDELVGNTPLVAFQRVTAHLPANVRIFAKAEWTNPGGSVKDRAALNIIETAQREGKLKPGITLVDSTSGNTGIAYAVLGAARGIKVKLFLPSNVSPERIAILRALGVDLVFTDPLEGSDGAIRAVRDLVAREPNNPSFHMHFGMALYDAGQMQLAKKEFENALRHKPSPSEEAKIKELVSRIG